MKYYNRFLDIMEKILLGISAFLMTVMVITICYEVVARYIFHNANTWSEEVARYSMEWIVMFIMPVAFRRHRITRVDFIVNKLPQNVVLFLQLFLYALIVIFIVLLGVNGYTMTMATSNQMSPGLRIPMSWMYSCQLVGPILMMIFLVECIIDECLIPIYHLLKGGKSE